MISRSQSVDLRIVAVWLDRDDRGRIVTKYAVEDADGTPIGVFLTPKNSLLSKMLADQCERNQNR